MARATAVVATPTAGPLSRLLGAAARQRELSLVLILVAMIGLVALQAPQFLSSDNLTDVSVLAAVIAVAAIGEAMVVITRNVDLSVEATMGLVAFAVAGVLANGLLPVPLAMLFGVGLGLVLGMVNGVIVAVFRVPSIVATLGTLQHLSRHRLPDRRRQAGDRDPAAGRLHRHGSRDRRRDPGLRARRRRRSPCVFAAILRHDDLRPLRLRGRQQPGGRRRSSASGPGWSPSSCSRSAACSAGSPA